MMMRMMMMMMMMIINIIIILKFLLFSLTVPVISSRAVMSLLDYLIIEIYYRSLLLLWLLEEPPLQF